MLQRLDNENGLASSSLANWIIATIDGRSKGKTWHCVHSMSVFVRLDPQTNKLLQPLLDYCFVPVTDYMRGSTVVSKCKCIEYSKQTQTAQTGPIMYSTCVGCNSRKACPARIEKPIGLYEVLFNRKTAYDFYFTTIPIGFKIVSVSNQLGRPTRFTP